jgi:hypothetical protein
VSVMQPEFPTAPTATVRQRYDRLLRAGFTPEEAASLIAKIDGIDRHAEGQNPMASVWRYQEITRLEFLRHLARAGQIVG